MMKQSTPGKLAFYSQEDRHMAQLAANLFNAEADKLEVWWSAEVVEEAANQSSTSDAQMVVTLGGKVEQPLSKTSIQASTEHWQVTGDEETIRNTLQSHISRLMVSLIMKGGKRPPHASTKVISSREVHAGPVKPEEKPQQGKSKGTVIVRLETKGRGGKKVTTINGLSISEDELVELAAKLKHACGTGGTIKDGVVEIQGDQRDRVVREMQNLGFKAKRG